MNIDNHEVGLSEDHKPNNILEYKRIIKAGHYVHMTRVDGDLAMSRAFGDFCFKDKKDFKQEE